MIRLGEQQVLYVDRITEHGAYLTEHMSGGEEAVLLPKGQVPAECERQDPITVFIYRDSKDRLIATTKVPKIMLHQTAVLGVVSVGKIGAFVDWGLEKDLLLPYHEQTRKVTPGEQVLVALYIDKSGRLCLTMNVYDYLDTKSPYHKDDTVSGRVYQISERFGAFVAIDNRYSALIPHREVYSDIKIGHDITARVTDVREDGKLTLSPRKKAYLQMDDDADCLLGIIDSFDGVLPFSDSAPAELIMRETGMSKNAFKRAAGRLYKDRKIVIEENCMRRNRYERSSYSGSIPTTWQDSEGNRADTENEEDLK